jgi:hypothetical protein
MVDVMPDVTSVTGARDRRWLILGVIGLAQLMVVLDLTVMNIALPSAQRALGFTTVDRQWVVTAYTLAFGSQDGRIRRTPWSERPPYHHGLPEVVLDDALPEVVLGQ